MSRRTIAAPAAGGGGGPPAPPPPARAKTPPVPTRPNTPARRARRHRTTGICRDRRAFLNSYDPCQDDADGTILARILQAVVPVCAGISLEYYFSFVDNPGYGCGTKLPPNIAALLGVMDGAASD